MGIIQPPNASRSRVTIVIICETSAAHEPEMEDDVVQCEDGGAAGRRSNATLKTKTSLGL